VSNEEKDAALEGAGDESERILEDTYLTGGVGMASPPRMSASAITPKDDGESYLFEDDSWRSHAEVEGEAGDAPPKPKGLGARLRSFFGG